MNIINRVLKYFGWRELAEGGFVAGSENTDASAYLNRDCCYIVIKKEDVEKYGIKFLQELREGVCNIEGFGKDGGYVGNPASPKEYLINKEALQWLIKK